RHDRRRSSRGAASLVRTLPLLPQRRGGGAVKRVLVAGIGNVFFGDDGFGVEVARQLGEPLPRGTRVADFGIRALHLAYELLDPPDLLVVADCMARGGPPGTLYVVEPEEVGAASPITDGHGMNIA